MTDIDPTAFEISFDPKTRRMCGVAVHGNTPFDVPFISQISDNLWQGGCENGLTLPLEIKHVVSLYPWEEYSSHKPVLSSLKVRLYDDLAGPDEAVVTGIAQWVNACRKTGPTLVHCQAGLNRSALVAGYALMLEGMSADNAITLMREKRSPAVLCNPVFEQWLRARSS